MLTPEYTSAEYPEKSYIKFNADPPTQHLDATF